MSACLQLYLCLFFNLKNYTSKCYLLWSSYLQSNCCDSDRSQWTLTNFQGISHKCMTIFLTTLWLRFIHIFKIKFLSTEGLTDFIKVKWLTKVKTKPTSVQFYSIVWRVFALHKAKNKAREKSRRTGSGLIDSTSPTYISFIMMLWLKNSQHKHH